MYRLFCSQFENVPEDQFLFDLAQKNWALILRNDCGALIAFSSMHVYKSSIKNRDVTLLYSGDAAGVMSTYAALGRWVESHHYRMAGPPREIYWQLQQASEIRVDVVLELQFPVETDDDYVLASLTN